MSTRAREFLIRWFAEHVETLPAARRLAQAVRLATKCRTDATAAGIPLQEVRDVASGDLILKILEALNAAAHLNCEVPLAPEIDASVESANLPLSTTL